MVSMPLAEALAALEQWKNCFISQVYHIDTFPKGALIALHIGFDPKAHAFTGIDALMRWAEAMHKAAKATAV